MQIALKSNNTTHFKSYRKLKKEKKWQNFEYFLWNVKKYLEKLQDKFQMFDSLKSKLKFLNNPMNE